MRPEVSKQARNRVARLQGQLRGIERMIDEDVYCVDILTQLSSIGAAIDGLGLLLLDDHVRTCVVDAVRGDEGAEKLDELMYAFRRFVRAKG
jgi:DNA-binding FrmR family transcriptional regulator